MEANNQSGIQGLVTVAVFNTLPEALAAKGFLEQNGIGVSMAHYHESSSMSAMMPVGIPLHVSEAESHAAAELLASTSNEMATPESNQPEINLHTKRYWGWADTFKIVCIAILLLAFVLSITPMNSRPSWLF